jgi:hypothetical protein
MIHYFLKIYKRINFKKISPISFLSTVFQIKIMIVLINDTYAFY